MTKETILRDYQLEMLDRLHLAWEKHQSVMVQMPTGVGKTILLAEVIREEFKINKFKIQNSSAVASGGVLVVAHRIELIDQISRTLDKFGIEHGLIVSGKPVDETKQVQVASIQTLSLRIKNEEIRIKNGFSLIIIDEAHHALAKTYKMLWDRWPEARFLGLTATPCRMNHAGFVDLFRKILVSWPIQEFIDKGWLSDFEYNTYKQYVDGKKGIVYAIDREHARHITKYYQEHGVSCCWIEAKTPAAEREKLIEDYRADKIKVCVNVDILGEGVDFPEVEFIQLARPTLSLSKY